ncbi:Dyp-type peroxidase [Glaciibacter superstes]|uniref:Dyp-type peroxidase n=1 Tax=Glaciibacter superstes TaxID=501023 RepID=UPI0003B58A34|nr:Dyp-type peroxidase [Glaciibacter superstes]
MSSTDHNEGPARDSPADAQAEPEKASGGISRRGMFGLFTATAALGVAGFAVASQVTGATSDPSSAGSRAGSGDLGAGNTAETDIAGSGIVEFDGLHQAGIATPAQSNIVLTSYDANQNASRSDLAATMKAWTVAARAMTSGGSAKGDPGISTGSRPANLTVTIGVGASLVQRLGAGRPAALADMPAFAGDQIDPARSDGDIVVQLCADDPLILAHAERVLTRLASDTLTLRWQEQGFGSTGARRDGRTGRNLMGQLDGTNNVTTSQLATSGPIWVDEAEPAWMTGGSYLVVRRIRMLLNTWEHESTTRQEHVIGRTKATGAPLGGKLESDFVDLEARNPDGSPTIPVDSHVRLSKPQSTGESMMRRGYSHRGAVLPDGTVDQGLLFLAYQKDPTTSFIPVQQRLSAHDALSAFTVTTGSAVFAILPGTSSHSDWLGSTLLA